MTKKLVLLSLIVYVVGAFSVVTIGYIFGDPDPNRDSAQSLLDLNNAAQAGIVDRTNDTVDKVVAANEKKETPQKVVAPTQASTPSSSTQPASSSEPSSSSPTPTPTPPATTACGQGGTCTVAEVATHNSRSDCWVIYNQKVYNVTSYVNQHPGGSGSFDSSTCGTDIRAQLQGQAGSATSPKRLNHPSSAYTILNSYFVANVAN
jgi:cell division protein FtsN